MDGLCLEPGPEPRAAGPAPGAGPGRKLSLIGLHPSLIVPYYPDCMLVVPYLSLIVAYSSLIVLYPSLFVL